MKLFRRRRNRRSRSGSKGRLARRVIRSAAGLLIGFYALCTLSLWILRSMNPLWTSVQIQHRIEAFVAGEDFAKRQAFVPLDRIPLELQHAVIAAEDSAFYQHRGIDWAEIKLVADEGASDSRGRARPRRLDNQPATSEEPVLDHTPVSRSQSVRIYAGPHRRVDS